MSEKIKVTKKMLMEKVLQGIGENGCEIIIRDFRGRRATLNEIIDPLAKYLERKGINVN